MAADPGVQLNISPVLLAPLLREGTIFPLCENVPLGTEDVSAVCVGRINDAAAAVVVVGRELSALRIQGIFKEANVHGAVLGLVLADQKSRGIDGAIERDAVVAELGSIGGAEAIVRGAGMVAPAFRSIHQCNPSVDSCS